MLGVIKEPMTIMKNYKKIGSFAAVFLLGVSVMLYSGKDSRSDVISYSLSGRQEFASSSIKIGVWNEYSTFNDDGTPVKLESLSYYKFIDDKNVVEPHRLTTLKVFGDFDESTTKFAWDIRREAKIGSGIKSTLGDPLSERLWGRSVERMFTSPGYNYDIKVTIYETSELGENTKELVEKVSYTQPVVCIYVRRELRDLTTADREEILSAMWVPYSMSMAEGQAKYGDQFMDVLSINSMHNYWAADWTCDHLHDGNGFSTQHLALILRYEDVIQAINPKIIMPYWEYTLESANIVNNHNGNYEKFYEISPVFTSNWFGSFETMQEPWSEIEIAKSTIRHNPFGQMRSPWNFAHDTKIMRFKDRCGFSTAKMLMDMEEPSSCYSFAQTLNLDSFTDFEVEIMHAPHGSIHIMLGGISGGCEVTYKEGLKEYFDDDAIARIAQLAAISVKALWREGMIDFTQCTTESPDKCQQVCVGDDYTAMGTLLWELFFPWNITPKDSSSDYLAVLGKVTCSTKLAIGDMYSSSATIDPLFWVMHTTTDRLTQFKRAKDFGFLDTDWPESTCFGHSPDDDLIYDISASVDSDTTLTNAGLFAITDPLSDDYAMRYIYDSFNYSHCDITKYPIFAKDYYPSQDDLDSRVGSQVQWGSHSNAKKVSNSKFSFMG